MTKASREDQNVRFQEDNYRTVAVFHTGYTPEQGKYINVYDSPALDVSKE